MANEFPIKVELDRMGHRQIVRVDVEGPVVVLDGGMIDHNTGYRLDRFMAVMGWRQAIELANALSFAAATARSADA